MSEFDILESQYRLIETQFLDDWMVFKAIELASNRIVCIRTPSRSLRSNPQRYAAFQRVVMHLPNNDATSVQYHPLGVYGQRDYLISTWVDTTLEDLLDRHKVLPPHQALGLLAQILSSLQRINVSGFTQGRLFPAHIGILDDAVLIDPLASYGTPDIPERLVYTAPELSSAASIDGRADVFAAGVITYRMLLGAARFERVVESSEMANRLTPLTELLPEFPEAVAQVIECMVSPAPADRFESPTRALMALSGSLDVERLESNAPPSDSGNARPPARPSVPEAAEAVTYESPPTATTLELAGPHRAHKQDSAFPAFMTVAILVLGISSVGYWWQFVYNKAQADEAMADVIAARDLAQTAEARILALDLFTRAERKLTQSRQAYDSFRYHAVAGLAKTAVAEFTLARDSALTASFHVAVERSISALQSAVAVEGINIELINEHLRTIENIKKATVPSEVADGKLQLAAIDSELSELIRSAQIMTLAWGISDFADAVGDADKLGDNNDLVGTHRHIELVRVALNTGDSGSTLAYYEQARDLFNDVLERRNWQSISALKLRAEQTRESAIAAGAQSLPRFAMADFKRQIALKSWQARDPDESELSFNEAFGLYTSLIEEVQATRARERATQARARLMERKDRVISSDFARGDAQLLIGDTAFGEQDYRAATTSFSAAMATFHELLEDAEMEQTELLHAQTVQAQERAMLQDAHDSHHFNKGQHALQQAQVAMISADQHTARGLLKNASGQFELAIKASMVAAARLSVTEIQRSATSIGLEGRNAALLMAQTMIGNARDATAAQHYDEALKYFSRAAAILQQAIEEALVAQTALESQQILLSTAEDEMRKTLKHALSIEVSSELPEFVMGHSHRQMGETLRAAGNLDAARTAFDVATEAFMQSVAVEIELRALRAREGAILARRDATDRGASMLAGYREALTLFAEATSSLADGHHEMASDTFNRAQSAFADATNQRVANQARKGAEEALADVRSSGAAETNSDLQAALLLMKRAQRLFSDYEFNAATELFIEAHEGVLALGDALKSHAIMEAQTQALDAKSAIRSIQIPPQHTLPQLVEGERLFTKAQSALAAGDVDLAISRFKAAKDQFDVAFFQAKAFEAKGLTTTARKKGC